ncbi:MAG: hypothetical protein B7Z63_04965 [Ignavibacteriae bacterium 37-53-5]|nr:MAG: hypothetical protein B7Z63_04965 [Ignavibacteriae bacterium 37-53-5]
MVLILQVSVLFVIETGSSPKGTGNVRLSNNIVKLKLVRPPSASRQSFWLQVIPADLVWIFVRFVLRGITFGYLANNAE